MENERLIIDGNAILNPAILRGVDHDDGRIVQDENGKDVQVNGHQYGVDNFWEKIKYALAELGLTPRDCVLVWDGRNAKQRRRVFLARYKEGRDKHPAVSEQLNIARDRCTKMALDLGMHVAHQDGMEADDLLGWFAANLRTRRNKILTGDGDICVLVDDNTDVIRLLPTGVEVNKNPYGPFPHKFITLYKALVGDTSDKIPGAKGFGDAAFVKLVRTFGLDGLELLQGLIENDEIPRLREDVDAMPELQRIIDSKDQVAISWRVARLHTEEVNHYRRPMNLRAGMVKQWNELADEDRVHGLKQYYGTKTLVHAGNYASVRQRFAAAVRSSPCVPLDIETSSCEESDEWVAKVHALMDSESTKDKVDVLGHELTGMSLTFGDNLQHTIYMSVDHAETQNITVDQCREMCELVPYEKINFVIWNRAFEFPVLYRAWGKEWKGNGWAGFVPNAIDAMLGASYVNENLPLSLKERSLAELGYTQQTFEEVTTLEGEPDALPPGGRLISFTNPPEGEGPVVAKRQYKMRELTAEHVFNYGCDDTITTGALHTHYQLVMEMENTWDVYMQVEQKPEYLTSLAFTQGIPISQEKLREMELKDDKRYEEAWNTLNDFLMRNGWEGTVLPTFDELTPANIKEAIAICVEGGEEFKSLKKKLVGLAEDLRNQFPYEPRAEVLALMIERNAVSEVNAFVKQHFTGAPVIKFNSPKQMQRLFYEVIGLTPRILNKLTDNQRKDEKYRDAWKTWRKIKDGKRVTPTDEERALWISKATTDDTAVDVALARDEHLTDEQKTVLKAYKAIKTVMTRRSLFYKTYKALPHWSDGKIHPHANQSRAVTRRYSYSAPNVQQLPKRGEGVEFRQIILPHKKGAVVVPPDYAGQELRLAAEQSGDENLTACYVGDNLKDVHSLTAVAAAVIMWGQEVTYDEFQGMRKSDDPVIKLKAKTLREDAKTTNFATQYDAMAERVSQELLCDEETAQLFIDAKEAAFPGLAPWKEGVRHRVEDCGFAVTMMGARRHLRDALMSENKWEAAKAGRQGPNFEIQGSAAEMTKLGACRVWDTGVFWDGRYDAQFYMLVHDELVFSIMGDQAAPGIREVHEALTAPYATMKIPVVSSISVGRTYGEQIELDEQIAEMGWDAAIRWGVNKALGIEQGVAA